MLSYCIYLRTMTSYLRKCCFQLEIQFLEQDMMHVVFQLTEFSDLNFPILISSGWISNLANFNSLMNFVMK